MTNLVVFRLDATPAVGGGHAMRCRALGEALSETGWSYAFAVGVETLATVPALAESGGDIVVLDAGDEPTVLRERWPEGCGLLVVDHYGRDAAFEGACRPWARRIAVIDDLADRSHDCEVLIDQTAGRAAADYRDLVPDHCRVLTGSDYALLDPRFAAARDQALSRRRSGAKAGRVLVSLGAVDADDLTSRVLEGIERSGLEVEVDVTLGRSAPHLERVAGLVRSLGARARLHVASAAMADLMAAADLAIGAGGTTSWERCCLGLPALVVVAADNQRSNAAALVEVGAARGLGWHEDVTADGVTVALRETAEDGEALAAMAEAAAGLCDGRGTMRAALGLLAPERAGDGRAVSLRPATMADCEIMFEWQCADETRRHAHNPAKPRHEEHRRWLEQSLTDGGRTVAIIEHGADPAGVLRLDGDGGPLTVSVLVAPERYRLGIAGAALRLARAYRPGATLHAEVLADNEASHRLFQRAGYRQRKPGLYVSEPVERTKLHA